MRPALPDAVLIRAALLGVFDPRELLDDKQDGYERDLSGLAELSLETAFGTLWLWTLTEDARRAALALLPPPGPARAAHLARSQPRDGDALGRAIADLLAPGPRADLRRLLAGQSVRMPDERLIALFKMLELIGSAGMTLPDWLERGDIRRRLQHAIMQRRAAKASKVVLRDRFRGRRRELAVLRDFALTGALPKAGTGAAPRLAVTDPEGVPALLVSGIGGTGKSALIEQLRRSLARSDKVVLAQFDLDRAALRMGDQVALAQELLRQIGYALPALDAGIATLRGQIRDAMALSQELIDIEAAASAILGALSGLRELLAKSGIKDRALVIVIDTFEEALVLGPQRVVQIAEWLRTLRDHGGFADLRVILSGRSTETLAKMPRDLAALGVITLDELGVRAGRAKLRDMFRRHGIAHEDLIPDLVAEFGSNPLVIEILAVYCRDNTRDEIAGLIGEGDPGARAAFGAEMRQRFLYTRILDRLTEPELKPLACPGLVLRRIEPAQIAGLLAGPCGLPVPMTPEHAQALFDRLATQVWLVQPSGPGGGMLEHLPELRRLMLPQILAEPAALEVARAASTWFLDGPGASQPGAEFDALYYAILAGDAELPDDDERLRDFALHLGAAAGDLPAPVQARLREAQGHVLSRAEITHLQGPARDRALIKRRQTQRGYGLETAVVAERVELAPAATEPTSGSAALAQSLFAAGQFDQLAKSALALTRGLIGSILNGTAIRPIAEPMHHPAYLSALALLADDDGRMQAFAAGLEDFLRELDEDPTPAARRAGHESETEIALMVLTVTGQLNSAAGRTLARLIDEPSKAPLVAQSLLQWRASLVRTPMTGSAASVALQVMPVFAPALMRMIGGSARNGISIENNEIAHDLILSLQHRMLALDKLHMLAAIESRLYGAVLHLTPEAAAQKDLRRIIPGPQPEFHAPLRVLLTEEQDPGSLLAAIAPFAALSWWPAELDPATFTTRLGATQMLSLIDTLDKFGGLTAFVASLAKPAEAPPRIRDLHRMMTRAEAAWARALSQS